MCPDVILLLNEEFFGHVNSASMNPEISSWPYLDLCEIVFSSPPPPFSSLNILEKSPMDSGLQCHVQACSLGNFTASAYS